LGGPIWGGSPFFQRRVAGGGRCGRLRILDPGTGKNYEICGLDKVEIRPRGEANSGATLEEDSSPGGAGPRGVLRIATVRLGLDQARLGQRAVAALLIKTLGSFDVVAIQDIRARHPSLLADLVAQMNAQGRAYEFALAPRVLREPVDKYSAMIFNRASVEIDRATVGEVADPARRLTTPPLVATFRARGPSPKEALTFTLVNVEVDPTRPAEERDVLAEVFRAVRDSGSGEDDVILLGDMGGDDRHYGRLAGVANLTSVLLPGKNAEERTGLTGNLFFDRLATLEFTGHGGVFDVMRQFGVSVQEAAEAMDQLPIWAEFSVYEGAAGGLLPQKK